MMDSHCLYCSRPDPQGRESLAISRVWVVGAAALVDSWAPRVYTGHSKPKGSTATELPPCLAVLWELFRAQLKAGKQAGL